MYLFVIFVYQIINVLIQFVIRGLHIFWARAFGEALENHLWALSLFSSYFHIFERPLAVCRIRCLVAIEETFWRYGKSARENQAYFYACDHKNTA